MEYIKQNKRGQSLVEVIVACGILGIVMTAIMSITVASKNLLYQSEDQTKATALTQEGIEVVRHQRDIGCSFDKIKNSDGSLKTNPFYIKADTVDPDPTDGTGEDLITTGSGNQIANFRDFTRQINIYNLQSVTGSDGTDATASTFQDTINGCGHSDLNYDCKDKYYLVKVEVKKGTVVLSTLKTIITK